MKAVNIDSWDIDPVNKDELDRLLCDTPNCAFSASWRVEGTQLSCSVCLLYERLADQRDEVEGLIGKVETVIGASFERINGRVAPLAATRVASGIVLAQRVGLARRPNV